MNTDIKFLNKNSYKQKIKNTFRIIYYDQVGFIHCMKRWF